MALTRPTWTYDGSPRSPGTSSTGLVSTDSSGSSWATTTVYQSPVFPHLTDLLTYLFFYPQPQASHSPTLHPVRRRNCSRLSPASRRTTTSCLRPKRRTSSLRKGYISGPWKRSTCACCKSMVNCPHQLLRELDLNYSTWLKKGRGTGLWSCFTLGSAFV